MRDPMPVPGDDLRVMPAGHFFYRHFRSTAQDTPGKRLDGPGNGRRDIPGLRELPENQAFEDDPVQSGFPAIGHRRMLPNGRRIVSTSGNSGMILLAMEEAHA